MYPLVMTLSTWLPSIILGDSNAIFKIKIKIHSLTN